VNRQECDMLRLELNEFKATNRQLWCEALELAVPVGKRRQWGDDHEGAPDVLRFSKMRQRADALHRLAKAHLVGENAVDALKSDLPKKLQGENVWEGESTCW
jgi:hypothetical protein